MHIKKIKKSIFEVLKGEKHTTAVTYPAAVFFESWDGNRRYNHPLSEDTPICNTSQNLVSCNVQGIQSVYQNTQAHYSRNFCCVNAKNDMKNL